jgi:hypothetical protein
VYTFALLVAVDWGSAALNTHLGSNLETTLYDTALNVISRFDPKGVLPRDEARDKLLQESRLPGFGDPGTAAGMTTQDHPGSGLNIKQD